MGVWEIHDCWLIGGQELETAGQWPTIRWGHLLRHPPSHPVTRSKCDKLRISWIHSHRGDLLRKCSAIVVLRLTRTKFGRLRGSLGDYLGIGFGDQHGLSNGAKRGWLGNSHRDSPARNRGNNKNVSDVCCLSCFPLALELDVCDYKQRHWELGMGMGLQMGMGIWLRGEGAVELPMASAFLCLFTAQRRGAETTSTKWISGNCNLSKIIKFNWSVAAAIMKLQQQSAAYKAAQTENKTTRGSSKYENRISTQNCWSEKSFFTAPPAPHFHFSPLRARPSLIALLLHSTNAPPRIFICQIMALSENCRPFRWTAVGGINRGTVRLQL